MHKLLTRKRGLALGRLVLRQLDVRGTSTQRKSLACSAPSCKYKHAVKDSGKTSRRTIEVSFEDALPPLTHSSALVVTTFISHGRQPVLESMLNYC